MIPITVDAGLNLLWVGISVFALLWFARSERIRSHHLQWRKIFAVFLAAVALFPIVSETDDLVHFSLLRSPGQHHGAGSTPEDSREKDTVHLARLLESLDHFQVTAFYRVHLSLCFVALLLILSFACFTRPVLADAGRAPPQA